MKRFFKNKKITLAIIIIFLSITYFFVNKKIESNSFDVITQENIEDTEDVEKKTVAKEIKEEIDVVTEDAEDEKEETKEESDEDDPEKIYVYVTGEVKIPGVVILNKGSRIIDAIEAAGGTTEKANITKVNLVYTIEDGMKINIPSNSDLQKDSKFEYVTTESGEGAVESEGTESKNQGEKESRKASVVNINTATQTELETIPGIGPSTALKIINYRKENGKFSDIEDIKNVKGIGNSKFEDIKQYITV